MKKTCRIAAIPGDGIGKEVLPEGIHVLQPPQGGGICRSASCRWTGQAVSTMSVTGK